MIHVRSGPFTSKDEADKWRTKLLSDGYNAILRSPKFKDKSDIQRNTRGWAW